MDMSDYQEKFAVSKLIGSPPGYVGYEGPGFSCLFDSVLLTLCRGRRADGSGAAVAVQRRVAGRVGKGPSRRGSSLFPPDSRALFSNLYQGNLFLSIFDEGQITDSKGFVVSFRNTIIVATSNLGSRHLAALPQGANVDSARAQVMAEIRAHLSPELLNRFDEVVLFRRLLPEHMAPIVRREVAEVAMHLPCPLLVSPEAEAALAAAAYDPAFGARPVRRTVQQRLVGPLSSLLAERAPRSSDSIVASLKPGQEDLEVHFAKD